MQFPDLSPLPIWGQVIVYSMFGISLAIIIGIARLGLMQGKRAVTADPGKAEVVSMVVDSSAIREATAEVKSLVLVLKDLAVQQKAIAEELDSVREEMRIHREISRRS